MRVATSTVSENIVAQVQKLGTYQARTQNQVATGQRIFNPEDDPSAVGRVLNLETDQRNLAQFGRNADRAMTLAQAVFSGLQSIKRVSDRAMEIGTLGSSTISAEAARAYAQEIDQLLEQGLQLANSKLANDHLFGGTKVDTPPFVATRNGQGQITAITYAGNTSRSEISLSTTSSVSANTSGATNSSLKDFLTNLVSMRDALTANNSSSVTTAQTSLVTTEDAMVSALGENGGIQARIEAARHQQEDLSTSLDSLISKETDVDLPIAIVKLNQTQSAYQAALQSGSMIMKLSLLDYIR